MGFERRVPMTADELHENLLKLCENYRYVDSIQLNEKENRIEVDLAWKANIGGHSDFYLPVKREGLDEARRLVTRMKESAKSGFRPTQADSQSLFSLIDTAGH